MIVGIDLGTTNSLIGVMDSGLPVLIPGAGGRRLTPSEVAILPDGSVVVGDEAGCSGRELVRSIKRLMGRRVGEADALPGQVGKPGECAMVRLGDRVYSPEQISAFILGKLKRDAEGVLGCPVDRAVISVPAYFHEGQRQATKKAAELAGITVERLLPEPTAAAMAFGLDRRGPATRVAVYDLGGGTFDISILELRDGVFEVLSTNGDTRLGGDDIDAGLARELGISSEEARAFKENSGWAEENSGLLRRVGLAVIGRTGRLCERALLDAGLDASGVDEVVLVGGATRLPFVRDFVSGIFGKDPNISQNPDEAVAIGAVIQAGILDGSVAGLTLLDVTPLSLGIETYGGLMNVIIPRNTTIPTKAGEMFTNAASGQTEMRIRILQGEREIASENWQLGEITVPFTPAPRGQARVGIQFEIDANGLLHVLARDTTTGRDSILKVESAVEVSDEAVEKMLEDSLENAFEDMEVRQLTEYLMKAEEMLPAVEEACSVVQLEVQEEQRIRAAAEAVREAAAARDLVRLKETIELLDVATQDLATRLLLAGTAEPGSEPERA